MTNTVQIPAVSVLAKVQGVEFTVYPETFHANATAAIFAYGLRRWFQDHVNSQAKAHRDSEAEDTFDAAACIDARLAQALSGEISTRGTAGPRLSAFEEALYDTAVLAKSGADWGDLATTWAAAKGLTTSERKAAILATIEAMVDERAEILRTVTQSRLDALAGLTV